MTSIYQLSATTLQSGEEISLDLYRGKYVLVVNTASECGFTPQYKGLESMYRSYKDLDFVVLGFPCNQFGKQEPGSAEDIVAFCDSNYNVSFPMFEKVEVNGPNAHPVFVYLKQALPGLLGAKIKWNFTKFLIGPEGRPLKRFAPIDTPEKIMKYLVKQMGRSKT